jgi:hypothetical protein
LISRLEQYNPARLRFSQMMNAGHRFHMRKDSKHPGCSADESMAVGECLVVKNYV